MSEIKISIYVVTFNRYVLLERCLNSILGQMGSPSFEVIVVDNGSSDSTSDLLEKYSNDYENFEYILLGENKGACYARNVAIRKGRGLFVTGSDDDDIWRQGRLKSLYQAYDESKAFTFGDDVFIFNSSSPKYTSKPELVTLESMKFQNEIGNQIFTTKIKFIEAGLFDETLVSAQDYDMWIRLMFLFGSANKAYDALQEIHLDGVIRITTSSNKRYGYFNFYRKHKKLMSREQRKHQLLTIKYICNESIGFSTYFKLFSFTKIKRKIKIFISRVITSGRYGF